MTIARRGTILICPAASIFMIVAACMSRFFPKMSRGSEEDDQGFQSCFQRRCVGLTVLKRYIGRGYPNSEQSIVYMFISDECWTIVRHSC